ncbi:MAG: hypothetical protein HY886_09195 [Deltaproteobacteria bacterium]|nr:hypothetical protein [Deltaproteobacteria bacterium]
MKRQAGSGKRNAGKDAHSIARTGASDSGNGGGKAYFAEAAPQMEGKGKASACMEIRKEYFPLVLSGRK